MNLTRCLPFLILIFYKICTVYCWTDEDLELFDLVESTDRKFYDILGVDQKAPASEIRKAYRRLSQLYHPDKNKEPNAEETFRKIAAIADVLRNEEQRKKYDIILQTGLPDWREPIYYYRRVRNMGLIELIIFLFCLATLGQYLFAWSAYWEKKYEIEEIVLSRMKKRNKHQRKSKNAKSAEEVEAIEVELSGLPKPKCQDLFPVQLCYFMVHFVQCLPSHLKCALENCRSIYSSRSKNEEEEEDDDYEEPNERRNRQKSKKHVKPQFPELRESSKEEETKLTNGKGPEHKNGHIQNNKNSSQVSEVDMNEFRKALKKFPNGTLQRWEKVSEYLQCSVAEVIAIAKQMKAQPYAKSVDISAQGVTGSEDTSSCLDAAITDKNEYGVADHSFENGGSHVPNGTANRAPNGTANHAQNGTLTHRANGSAHPLKAVDKIWSQDEQKLLEQALLKFPKDTLARWERISDFVKTKTKEECITRYKELAQQIKKKKGKEN